MEVLFKEQNIARKAEQLLLLKALGLGKSINQIDGSMKLVNGSISSIAARFGADAVHKMWSHQSFFHRF